VLRNSEVCHVENKTGINKPSSITRDMFVESGACGGNELEEINFLWDS
jgi:hypothetical protein